MALTIEEILEAKSQLGYNVTGVGAEPYISYAAVFDRAVQPYLIDYSTTSTTSIAANAGSADITLASNPTVTGSDTQANAFVVGSRVVVDVGPAQETSMITRLSGLVATMTLTNAHSGTYPVRLCAAEGIIRDILERLRRIETALSGVAITSAGVVQVDEVKLSPSERRGGRSKFDELIAQRDLARDDLAAALGVPCLNGDTDEGGGMIEVY